MDDQSLKQLRSLWPDVAGPFSRIIPDGCTLIHTLDAWTGGRSALRRRLVDLARAEHSPELEALLDEAEEDADRRGWTRLDDDDAGAAPGERILELEGVLLRLAIRDTKVLGEPWPVLRVVFDQPWPPDAGAPVETSDMFQNLVRQLLKLGGHPERLSKDLVVDPFDLTRADVLEEVVELPKEREIMRELVKLSFTPEPDPRGEPGDLVFVSKTTTSTHDLTARVREVLRGTRYEVAMTKKRLTN
ncbi:hypothetical protein L6R52_22900 [Myxococcota bacterium]|nr:hypothetical protein [Myxococcota bacterium]